VAFQPAMLGEPLLPGSKSSARGTVALPSTLIGATKHCVD
jgi:hypothetical protein